MSTIRPFYIAGKPVHTGQTLEVINPYTNDKLATCAMAGPEHLEEAIGIAYRSSGEIANTPTHLRAKALNEIAANIENKLPFWAEIISAESGKPMKYALAEASRAAFTLRLAAEETHRLPAEYLMLDAFPGHEKTEAWVRYFPIGLVSGITPFNFPLNLLVHKIAPAIAAGCPIIIKPDLRTPLSALALAESIASTALHPAVCSVLPLMHTHAEPLIKDERIKLLSFTGSPTAGWAMKQNAGKKRVTLELGGNAGAIVCPSASLQEAVNKCLVGAFAYSGQVCIHTQRIYIHKSIYSKFEKAFLEAVSTLKRGNPVQAETDISVMIDEAAAQRVEAWVEEALSAGAIALCGGKREGTYYPPTVLTNCTRDMKVHHCEIFGPVVLLESYETIEEVVTHVNDSEFGLQAGIFTHWQPEIDYAFQHIQAGGIIINDTPTFRSDKMPYGGVKNSGFGREGVAYAIHDMMEPKVLVKKQG